MVTPIPKPVEVLIRPTRWFQMFSDETKERIVRSTEIAKTLVHYLWIPTILLVGKQSWTGSLKPARLLAVEHWAHLDFYFRPA